MSTSSSVKGLQSIKSSRKSVKSAIPNRVDSDYFKLYLFEKERSRLQREEKNILLRLAIIQSRLKEIQLYYDEKARNMTRAGMAEGREHVEKDEKQEWQKRPIEY